MYQINCTGKRWHLSFVWANTRFLKLGDPHHDVTILAKANLWRNHGTLSLCIIIEKSYSRNGRKKIKRKSNCRNFLFPSLFILFFLFHNVTLFIPTYIKDTINFWRHHFLLLILYPCLYLYIVDCPTYQIAATDMICSTLACLQSTVLLVSILFSFCSSIFCCYNTLTTKKGIWI